MTLCEKFAENGMEKNMAFFIMGRNAGERTGRGRMDDAEVNDFLTARMQNAGIDPKYQANYRDGFFEGCKLHKAVKLMPENPKKRHRGRPYARTRGLL